MDDFAEALRLDPERSSVYYNRSIMRCERGDYDGRARRCRRGDPVESQRSVITYSQQAKVSDCFYKQIRAKPRDDFTEAILPGLANADTYANRGNAFAQIKNPSKAIADFKEAIQRDPKFAFTYLFRGSMELNDGDLDKAIADFSECIRLEPTVGGAYYFRASTYLKQGAKAKADDDFLRAKKLGVNVSGADSKATDVAADASTADTPNRADESLFLPRYVLLGNRIIQDEVGLNKKQRQQLHEIAVDADTAIEKLGSHFPAGESPEATANLYSKKVRELRDSYRGKIEAVLTPEQLVAIKKDNSSGDRRADASESGNGCAVGIERRAE